MQYVVAEELEFGVVDCHLLDIRDVLELFLLVRGEDKVVESLICESEADDVVDAEVLDELEMELVWEVLKVLGGRHGN